MLASTYGRWCFAVALALLLQGAARSVGPPSDKGSPVDLKLQRVIEHGLCLSDFAISPDSKTLAVVGEVRRKNRTHFPVLRLWSLDSGKMQREIILTKRRVSIQTVRFAPDGTSLAVVMGSGRIEVRNVENGERTRRLAVPGKALTLDYSQDGKRLVVGSSAGKLHIWETNKWANLPPVPVPGGKDASVWNAAFSPDGARFAVILENGTIHVWECPRWKHAFSVDAAIKAPDIKFDLYYVDVLFSPDSRSLAAIVRQSHRFLIVSDDHDNDHPVPARGVALFDARTGKVTKQFGFHATGAHSVVFSRDGRWGISCGLRSLSPDIGQITITDLKSDTVLLDQAWTFKASLETMRLAPNGRTLVAQREGAPFEDGPKRPACVLVWELKGGK